jgi:ABC-type multidrug transport system fused ATPase/permease subunit
MAANTYPLLDLFWTIFEIFAFVIWIWVLVTIFADIFRSHDMGGFAKALWFMLVLFLPLIGILLYLIVRGSGMHERSVRAARAQQEAFDTYIRQAAAPSTERVEELSRLADRRASGAISEQEYQAEKARLLS